MIKITGNNKVIAISSSFLSLAMMGELLTYINSSPEPLTVIIEDDPIDTVILNYKMIPDLETLKLEYFNIFDEKPYQTPIKNNSNNFYGSDKKGSGKFRHRIRSQRRM